MKDEYGTRKTPACQPKTEPFALIRPPLWQIFCALALIYMGATRGVEKDLYYFLKKLNQLCFCTARQILITYLHGWTPCKSVKLFGPPNSSALHRATIFCHIRGATGD